MSLTKIKFSLSQYNGRQTNYKIYLHHKTIYTIKTIHVFLKLYITNIILNWQCWIVCNASFSKCAYTYASTLQINLFKISCFDMVASHSNIRHFPLVMSELHVFMDFFLSANEIVSVSCFTGSLDEVMAYPLHTALHSVLIKWSMIEWHFYDCKFMSIMTIWQTLYRVFLDVWETVMDQNS